MEKVCSLCGRVVDKFNGRRCHKCHNALNAGWYAANGDRVRAMRKRNRLKTRLEVLSYYSPGSIKCACCGEGTYEFLAIDHINGTADKHASGYSKSGWRLGEWLKRQGFPSGYRVLCHNCNCARGFYGRCPHDGGAQEGI